MFQFGDPRGLLRMYFFLQGEGGKHISDGANEKNTSAETKIFIAIFQCGNTWVSSRTPEAAPGQPQDNPRTAPGAILRPFWARLGDPGAIMGPSQGIVGTSWQYFGDNLKPLGTCLDHLANSLERRWHHFAPSWSHVGHLGVE